MVSIFRPHRVALAAYAGFIALSAYFGSIGMISGLLPVRASLAERLPFHSPVFGGIALALIVGLPTSFVAVLSWRRHPRTSDASALAGLMLVGWITVELAIAREFSALQVVYAAAGAGLIAFGNVAVLRQVADDAQDAARHQTACGNRDAPPSAAFPLPRQPEGHGTMSGFALDQRGER